MRARLAFVLVFAAAVTTAHAQCPDQDFDGICDADDVCTTEYTQLSEATLRITSADAPYGDERLRLRGRIVMHGDVASQFVDPASGGVRVVLELVDGLPPTRQTLLSAVIPGGAGWRARGDGTAWTYRDGRGAHGGVTRISVKRRVSLPVIPPEAGIDRRETFDVQVLAKRGTYDALTADLLDGFLPGDPVLDVAVGFGPVGGNFCASRIFPNQQPPIPCTINGDGSVAQCSTAPATGPCRLGEPRDAVACEAITVAALQERYRASHGHYLASPDQRCDDLPGYVSSQGLVTCALVTYDDPDAFSVHVGSPYYLSDCSYESLSPVGQRLSCDFGP
jgi:hypothetical protein